MSYCSSIDFCNENSTIYYLSRFIINTPWKKTLCMKDNNQSLDTVACLNSIPCKFPKFFKFTSLCGIALIMCTVPENMSDTFSLDFEDNHPKNQELVDEDSEPRSALVIPLQ